MKGKFKKAGIAALSALAVLSLASCGTDSKGNLNDIVIPDDASDFKSYALVELMDVRDSCKPDTLSEDVKKALGEVYVNYSEQILNADNEDYAKIYQLTKEAKKEMAKTIPYANGLISYASESNDVKTGILGALEKFAVDNGITGMTLYEMVILLCIVSVLL